MKLSKTKLLEALAGTGFIILFPGFLLYHLGVAYRIIPAFAAGLFGYASVAFFALFVFTFPFLWKRAKAAPFFWLTIVFLAYIVALSGFYYFLVPDELTRIAAVQSFQTVVFWGALVFVGFFLPWRSPWLAWSLLVFATALVLYLVFYVITTGAVMFDARRVLTGEGVASYQGFARSAVVVFLFLVAVYSAARARLLLVVTGAFALFVLGARAELYGFLAVVLMFALLRSLASVKQLVGFSFGFFVIGVALFMGVEYWEQSRQFHVLDLGAASSWIARMELQALAVEQILASPFVGEFGGHVRFDSVGGYAHNALSAWVNYGFLGFLIFSYLTFAGALGSGLKIWREKTVPAYWELAFLFNAFSLVLVVVAKSVFWPVPALGWAFYAMALVHEREKRSADMKVPLTLEQPVVETTASTQLVRPRGNRRWIGVAGSFRR
ncbi:hypothetical protein [Thioalkalivibrio paradoxus]|uniref:O-antigen polymerase n=1 Tax=Thioalkalivibrio paradoxus ARh 1 TaxID=713585 RepID=W0DNF6_9GAMM|nr:hypothetical protein [Thioalkalivibrio paradoxus]AHE99991.1 hypothetical protein THITH_05795 [Thioalkalivibrio paradoxus ARh 1]